MVKDDNIASVLASQKVLHDIILHDLGQAKDKFSSRLLKVNVVDGFTFTFRRLLDGLSGHSGRRDFRLGFGDGGSNAHLE